MSLFNTATTAGATYNPGNYLSGVDSTLVVASAALSLAPTAAALLPHGCRGRLHVAL